MFRTVDGLQDRPLQTFAARRDLPHNILDAIFHEGSKIGIVKIQDWLIKLGTRAETQDFLMLFVGDCLREQAVKAARTLAR